MVIGEDGLIQHRHWFLQLVVAFRAAMRLLHHESETAQWADEWMIADDGRPVFDDAGNVIGILVAGAGSYAGFIPMSAICNELPRY